MAKSFNQIDLLFADRRKISKYSHFCELGVNGERAPSLLRTSPVPYERMAAIDSENVPIHALVYMYTMPWTDKHISWLKRTKDKVSTNDGKKIEVWAFEPSKNPAIMAAWAKHFRNHYCLDTQIDLLRNSTGQSRSEYLKAIKFPDAQTAPGPSIRSGDFAELLVADYVRYVLKYWVPRTRYGNKAVRNESTKGSDILGFKIIRRGSPSNTDELVLFEAKAQLTGEVAKPRLQDAIDDSMKDEIRKAESLNAIKQKLLDSGEALDVATVERFQNAVDRPYTERYGAAAIFSTSAYCETTITSSSTAAHPHAANLSLLVIRGDNLMGLAHDLYQRAADEA